MLKPLLAYSNHSFGSHSSYPIISQHLSNSYTLSILRREPDTFGKRILNSLVRPLATSQWYKLTSLKIEWLLVKNLLRNHHNLVHYLWADRDLGYINLLDSLIQTPVCCTFHCCPEDLPEILTFPKRLKKLAALIIMSETQRSFFESCGVDPDKIHFIPHGIDVDFFVPSTEKKDLDRFTVLSVGSYKRNFSLLREVAIRMQKYPDICIKIVSSKDFHSFFADLENVEFVSGLTDSQLVETYQTASCLLLAVENATANNALLEGLACGLPIVAENIGGIPEYVNTSCAILTEARDPDLLTEAIVHLAQSPSQCNEMSEASRKRALELSWPNIAKKTEELYASLV